MRHLKRFIRKAVYDSSELQTNGGELSPEQAATFLRIAIDATVMARDGRQEFSRSRKFQVARIDFGGRQLHRGSLVTEGSRIDATIRAKPTTGLLELSTETFRGEMPVSDEVFEDNIEGDAHADTIVAGISEAVGRDIEEIAIKSDTDRTGAEDEDLDGFDGIIAQAQDDFPAGQKLDMTGETTAESILKQMWEALPSKYRREPRMLRIWVPTTLADQYMDELAARGTPLGDRVTEDGVPDMKFRGVPVREVPLFSGTSNVNTVAVNYETFALLTHRRNIVWGFHRRVRLERFRDPRDAATSFLPTVRFDVGFGDPSFGVLAENVPTSF